jgi:predicted amidohydrolase YtcJ
MKALDYFKSKEQVDLIVYNAQIYTVDQDFSIAEAFAVKDGRFVAVGNTDDISSCYSSGTELDMKGKPLYPGFHDAHCHFVDLANSISYADLRKATSFDDALNLIDKHDEYPPGWIVGTGLNEENWKVKKFPTNEKLNQKYPNTPVILKRIDEHAIVANEEAIRMANIQPDEVVDKNGIFKDSKAYYIWSKIAKHTEEKQIELILRAATQCYKQGLTSVTDAGLPADFQKKSIELLDKLHKSGSLSLRIDAWLYPSEENFNQFKKPYRNNRLTVTCFKLMMDGALGSRGAWMLKPYSDKLNDTGKCEYPNDDTGNNEIKFLDYCQRAFDSGMQVATHCIGDAANQKTLELYGKILEGKNDRRWRIEHAQIVAPDDFESFKKYSVIPSVQPTHATSDTCGDNMALKRIGPDRLRNAYAYQELKKQLGWLPFGTDFPVENLNPIDTFFAAVFRKKPLSIEGGFEIPEGEGFQMENAISSRKDALRAMTIWAAKASFDEDQKGSIEQGKWADFVVLDRDIMIADEKDIPETKVLYTHIAGECVFQR